ncbi:MAG: GH3 family domain-containing protein, partial [Desulfocapsaceae bacterium]
MGLIASTIIGLAARRSAGRFEKAVRDPAAAQNARLREMMERNKDTEYGRQYGFAKIRSLEDYRKAVPIVSYEDIRERIDRATRNEKNILTAEDPILFAQTSGTTGEPKYIPVTPTCQKGGGMTTWLHYARKDHPKMLRGKIVTIVSPAV